MIYNMSDWFKDDSRLSNRTIEVVICPDGPTLVTIDRKTIGIFAYGEQPYSTYTGYRALGIDEMTKCFDDAQNAIRHIVELHLKTGLFLDLRK